MRWRIERATRAAVVGRPSSHPSSLLPGSVRQGFRWWEVDLTYYGLRLLEGLGLVYALKPVPTHVMAKAHA